MKVVDLFCGCGGMSLGLQNAGFNICAGYDAWDKALGVYRDNFHHSAHAADLSEEKHIIEIQRYSPDVVVGGPPCQDFSDAGLRQEGGRAHLTETFAKIVAACSPRFFIMENVPAARKSLSFQMALEILSGQYEMEVVVANASLYGVPQRRKRLFLLGAQSFPVEKWGKSLIQMASPSPISVREYTKNTFPSEHFYNHPRNYNRRAVFSIDEPAPTMRGQSRPISPGYPGHHLDSASVSQAKALTWRDRAILQTFPDTFVFRGTKTNLDQMIGNSVPPKLAEAVGAALLKNLTQ